MTFDISKLHTFMKHFKKPNPHVCNPAQYAHMHKYHGSMNE